MFDKITHLSFSSLWLYLTDRVKWGRQYVDGIKDEPSLAMQVGSQVHKDIELYLRGEGGKDASPFFAYWLEWFDTKTGLILSPEVKGLYESMGQRPIVGYMDAVTDDKQVVYDWKIVDAFTKTEFDLRQALQAGTYGLLVQEAKKVIFVEVKKPKSRNGIQVKEREVLLTPILKDTVQALFTNMHKELEGEHLTPEWKDLYYIESILKDALDLDSIF